MKEKWESFKYSLYTFKLGCEDFFTETVTPREILVSIVMICLFVGIGIPIGEATKRADAKEYNEYSTATQIFSTDGLKYGMKTNIGRALVYGELKVIDPVRIDDIKGEYSYIKKVKERYTMHTRQVAHTRRVGKTTTTYYTTETYWTWDEIDREVFKSKRLSLLNVEIPYGTFPMPPSYHKETIKESSNIRYCYYVSPISTIGTADTTLKNQKVESGSFYDNEKPDQVVENTKTQMRYITFVTLWTLAAIGSVVTFVFFDNDYLNPTKKRESYYTF